MLWDIEVTLSEVLRELTFIINGEGELIEKGTGVYEKLHRRKDLFQKTIKANRVMGQIRYIIAQGLQAFKDTTSGPHQFYIHC